MQGCIVDLRNNGQLQEKETSRNESKKIQIHNPNHKREIVQAS